MILNTTKDKGDLGLISVIKDLELKNIKTCLPISEHLPFDLIAVNENGKLLRISVKYKKLKNNTINIPLRAVYSNTKGSFAKTIDMTLIDYIAVYCPDLDKCFYIGVKKLLNKNSSFVLRPQKFIKINDKRINVAEDYVDIHFKENCQSGNGSDC